MRAITLSRVARDGDSDLSFDCDTGELALQLLLRKGSGRSGCKCEHCKENPGTERGFDASSCG